MMTPKPGMVYLVGAGPGDPGLLTRRGFDILTKADVVVYDHLANDRLLDLAPKSAERFYAGKTQGRFAISQDEINRLLVDRAGRGLRVVRLKGGDPYVFGRGAEEAEFLHSAGVPFTVVPGVTAGVGVTAYAGLPITHRSASSAVAFVTGHDDPEAATAEKPRVDWAALARFPGTLVVYMGVTRLPALCRTLIREGKPPTTPAALIQSGTLPRQRSVVATLADLPERVVEAGLGPPALFVVGEVITHRPELTWFEDRPLFGRRIVVTRPESESDHAASSLEELGAEVLLAPMVRIRPIDDPQPLDDVIGRLDRFDWLVFTSSNGVTHFIERLKALGRDLRSLGRVKLAVIGSSTEETLASYHLRADLVPSSARSEGLVDVLLQHAVGQRILLARADRGRSLLKDELGPVADVEQVAVYSNADAESLPVAVLDRIKEGSVDWITLTSSAGAERLFSLLPEPARAQVGSTIKLATISPVTSATAHRLGWSIAAEASTATWDGLVDAIVKAESNPPA